MPDLSSDLEGILRANEVPEAVQTWMKENGCYNLKRFANFVDDVRELNTDILAKTSEKDKRGGTLQGGTPREAFGLITETDSINKGGDTVKSLIVDEFDGWLDGEGNTGGIIDWLAGDASSMRSINDVVMKALKPAVKRNIANNDELANVSTSLIEDAKQSTFG